MLWSIERALFGCFLSLDFQYLEIHLHYGKAERSMVFCLIGRVINIIWTTSVTQGTWNYLG